MGLGAWRGDELREELDTGRNFAEEAYVEEMRPGMARVHRHDESLRMTCPSCGAQVRSEIHCPWCGAALGQAAA